MSSKSLIPTHPFPLPSFDEPHLPLADLTSIFYDDSTRPFSLFGLAFSELPEATRTFLTENADRLPTRLCLSANEEEEEEEDGDGLSAYFEILLRFREEEQARLGRRLEGVHRAIVKNMVLAKTSSPVDAHAREEAETDLRTILLPEWRSHLDSHLTRIDALIWFEMEMRRGLGEGLEMGYEQCVRERREDVRRMVGFAVRGLQGVNESVRERGVTEEDGVELLEGHISIDSGSGSGDGSSGSSGSGSSDEYEDADDEESIFSESDFDMGCATSDSEAQWIDFDSAFRRVVA